MKRVAVFAWPRGARWRGRAPLDIVGRWHRQAVEKGTAAALER